ncbi:zinc finger B-box domain-containing protein 1 isoform 2-T3 [Molossus nigricans]
MNNKDFVVLPWGKPGHSVKLKYKSSGYHWKSGKVGKLGYQSHVMSQNKGNVIKVSPGKLKLKLLREQLQAPVRQPHNYKMANSSGSEKPKIKGKACGQCEKKAALLVCLECGEDYCSGCFAKIHQKGALKLHRTTLLQARSQILSNILDVAHRFIKEVNPDEPKGKNHSTKEIIESQHKPKSPLPDASPEMEISTAQEGECTNPTHRLLHEGSFDEEASAQSFQEVLNEWRNGRHGNNGKQNSPAAEPDSLGECEVQTNLKIWREPLHIEFKEDSISYMEKLWLKKHRRTPQEQLGNMLPDTSTRQCPTTSEAPCSQNESNEDSDVDEMTVQRPALFLPVEKLSIERPETSVKIVELDETFEEELEERGNIVPYKVELADAESQPSCTFYDYHTFLHENDIHQHHVFTKGKTDLLHLHLSSNSSYCEDNSKVGTSNTKFGNNVDPDVDSPAVEKLGKSSSFERHFKEKGITDMESSQKLDNSCIAFESKESFPSVDLETSSTKEKLSQDIKESWEFSNLTETPNFEDSKTTESLLLLQEIALRSKPITEKYQGLERFFVPDKNERLNLLSSHSSKPTYSSTRITFAGNRDWIPEQSICACADSAAASGAVQSAQDASASRTQPKTGRAPHRPSTASLPVSTSVRRSSSCLSSFYSPPRSAPAQPSSRAASEISEIGHIDITGHKEPFSDSIADQQSLDSLEKEFSALRNLAGPSEKFYSLTSEESPALHNDSPNISQASPDLFQTSHPRGLCATEELSSSEKDTEIQSFLTASESSTDEEEEDFLDKQHVITLPWPKST